MSVRLKSLNPAELTSVKMPTSMHIVLHSDNIIEIGATGVQVFD